MDSLLRTDYLQRIATAIARSPVVALLGPRQCGKTTLAKQYARTAGQVTFFDLESVPDLHRLENPELALGRLRGLVILDEIQRHPALFAALRVLADRPLRPATFLILGSASPQLIKGASESLAGRVEFVDVTGFTLAETSGQVTEEALWLRGGFPASCLASGDEASMAWRSGFIRTFLEQDLPQLGIRIPAPAMRRFWTMLAHYHGQTWNASEAAGAMGMTSKTMQHYLDILTETYMMRQLQPWHENISKRQVKAQKIYFRDSGILHALMSLPDFHSLTGHPKSGASWEGFALEQVLACLRQPEAYFWATHADAELDLLVFHKGKRYGFEFKYSDAPSSTRSMRVALADLGLAHLWVVHAGPHAYPIDEKITAIPLGQMHAGLFEVNLP